MSQAIEAGTISVDEYLTCEELQEKRHEYNHAEIFAMGIANCCKHVSAARNIFAALK